MPNYEIIKDLTKKIGKTAFTIITYPFAIPTYMRKANEADIKGDLGRGLLAVITPLSAFIGGPILTSVLSLSHIKEYQLNQNENLLIFPAATIAGNLASGIYEWYRYEKNKKISASTHAIPLIIPTSNIQPNNLEQKVEEPPSEPKIQIQPIKQIPNPWDIDIDEIGQIGYRRER